MSHTMLQSSPSSQSQLQSAVPVGNAPIQGLLNDAQLHPTSPASLPYPTPPKATSVWEEFSSAERADCFGRLYETRWNSRYRWEVRGELNQLWKKVLPILESVEQQNYGEIYGKGGQLLDRRLEIALLSSSEDTHEAEPTVLIQIRKRRVGNRMKSLFEKHQHCKELRSGLVFEVWKGHMKFLAAGSPLPASSTVTKGQFDSLCGSAAFVTKLPPTEDSAWRKITIGGLILDPKHDIYYAVTVGHCFGDQEDFGGSDDTDSIDSDSDSSSTPAEHVVGPKRDSTARQSIQSKNAARTSPNKPQDSAPYGVYIDSSPRDESENIDTSSRLTPKNLALVGEQAAPVARTTQNPLDALDCTLVRVYDSRFMQRNCIETPWNTQLLPQTFQHNQPAPYGEAVLVSGTSGVKRIPISGTEVSLRFPWHGKSQIMWSLETKLGM